MLGQEFLALLERIKGASSEADLEECQREYKRQRSARKRRRSCAGAEVRLDMLLSCCLSRVHSCSLLESCAPWNSALQYSYKKVVQLLADMASCVASQGRGQDATQESMRTRTETLVSPGLYKVELLDDEQSVSSGGKQESPIRL